MVEIKDDKNRLRLSIIDYEFPGKNDSEYDDNWLIIRIDVEKGDLKWTCSDPALLTWEFQKISEWFLSFSEHESSEDRELYFIEPVISFSYNGKNNNGGYEISVILGYEFFPDGLDKTESTIDFVLSNPELKRISEEFKSELKKFPQRL